MELEPRQDGQPNFKSIPNGLDNDFVVRNFSRSGGQEKEHNTEARKSHQMDGTDLKNLPVA